MCAVSSMGDHYTNKWKDLLNPPYNPNPYNVPPTPGVTSFPFPNISREEFDKLKAEVEEMKKILIIAKLYDDKTGQPHCEMEEKVAALKKIAELVGVDLSEIFESKNK